MEQKCSQVKIITIGVQIVEISSGKSLIIYIEFIIQAIFIYIHIYIIKVIKVPAAAPYFGRICSLILWLIFDHE